VEGCTRTVVEHDHRYGAEFKHTGHTRLDELDPVCPGHHDLHTNHGWALIIGTGKRAMVPPDDPRHPSHLPGARAGPAPPPAASPAAGPRRRRRPIRDRPSPEASTHHGDLLSADP
jgi:hypothetical protein